MTAAEHAIAELGAVCRALARLPDQRGTAREIAAHSGLPPALVLRRLKGSHTGSAFRASAAFTLHERGIGAGQNKRPAVWGLTARGVALARTGEGT